MKDRSMAPILLFGLFMALCNASNDVELTKQQGRDIESDSNSGIGETKNSENDDGRDGL